RESKMEIPGRRVAMKRTWVLVALALVSAALVASLPATAQTTAGQITGRITDSSGALVINAAVTAINAATGVSRETTYNQLGNYTVAVLEGGVYRVTWKKEGFRLQERSGVTLHVNAVIRLDFLMTLGAVNESVSVTADVPLLQASESSLKAVIDNKKVIDL